MSEDFETKFSASSNKKEESMSCICKCQGKEAQKVRCLSISYVLSTILLFFFFFDFFLMVWGIYSVFANLIMLLGLVI